MHLEIVYVPNTKSFNSFYYFLKMIEFSIADMDKKL
jgi:hypothetical protein